MAELGSGILVAISRTTMSRMLESEVGSGHGVVADHSEWSEISEVGRSAWMSRNSFIDRLCPSCSRAAE
jgi:hypothetical protein